MPDRIFDDPIVNPRTLDLPYFPPPDYNSEGQLLQGLASALSSFNPILTRFSLERESRLTKKDIVELETDLREKELGLKEAVDSGYISVGENPRTEYYIKKTLLNNAGKEYALGLDETYRSSNILDSDAPEALEDLINSYNTQFYTENSLDNYDPVDVFDHFQALRDDAVHKLRARHSNQKIIYNEERAKDEAGTAVNLLIDTAIASQGSLDTPEERQETVLNIVNGIADIVLNGIPRKEANDIVVDAIILNSLEHMDTDILDIIKEIKTTGNASLADIPEYASKMLNAEIRIANEIRKDEVRDRDAKRDRSLLRNIFRGNPVVIDRAIQEYREGRSIEDIFADETYYLSMNFDAVDAFNTLGNYPEPSEEDIRRLRAGITSLLDFNNAFGIASGNTYLEKNPETGLYLLESETDRINRLNQENEAKRKFRLQQLIPQNQDNQDAEKISGAIQDRFYNRIIEQIAEKRRSQILLARSTGKPMPSMAIPDLEAVKLLISEPDKAEQFDAQFGDGTSKRFLTIHY